MRSAPWRAVVWRDSRSYDTGPLAAAPSPESWLSTPKHGSMDGMQFLETVRSSALAAGLTHGGGGKSAPPGEITWVWAGTGDRRVEVIVGGPLIHVEWQTAYNAGTTDTVPQTAESAAALGKRIADFLG